MDRKTLFDLLDKERKYQSKWDDADIVGRLKDEDIPIEVWSNWMQHVLREADNAAYRANDKSEAVKRIYEAVSLGLACLEHNIELIPEDYFVARYKK